MVKLRLWCFIYRNKRMWMCFTIWLIRIRLHNTVYLMLSECLRYGWKGFRKLPWTLCPFTSCICSTFYWCFVPFDFQVVENAFITKIWLDYAQDVASQIEQEARNDKHKSLNSVIGLIWKNVKRKVAEIRNKLISGECVLLEQQLSDLKRLWHIKYTCSDIWSRGGKPATRGSNDHSV